MQTGNHARDMPVRLLILLLVFLRSLAALWADALDRRQVPAAAAWLIHFDADAARESLDRPAHCATCSSPSRSTPKPSIRRGKHSEVDPVRDIRSITLYGTTYAPEAGVVLARGKVDRPRIEGFLRALPGFRSDTIDGHTLYFWTETAPNRRHDSAGAFFGADTVVIAPDASAVLAALAVLQGNAPGLSGDSVLMADVAPGAILQASAAGLAQAKELTIQSPVVRQCESGSVSDRRTKG